MVVKKCADAQQQGRRLPARCRPAAKESHARAQAVITRSREPHNTGMPADEQRADALSHVSTHALAVRVCGSGMKAVAARAMCRAAKGRLRWAQLGAAPPGPCCLQDCLAVAAW